MKQQPLLDQGIHITQASRPHSDTPYSVVLLWASDQPDAVTCNWQHTSLQKRQTPMPPTRFEPAIPASERQQTHALESAAIWIGP